MCDIDAAGAVRAAPIAFLTVIEPFFVGKDRIDWFPVLSLSLNVNALVKNNDLFRVDVNFFDAFFMGS